MRSGDGSLRHGGPRTPRAGSNRHSHRHSGASFRWIVWQDSSGCWDWLSTDWRSQLQSCGLKSSASGGQAPATPNPARTELKLCPYGCPIPGLVGSLTSSAALLQWRRRLPRRVGESSATIERTAIAAWIRQDRDGSKRGMRAWCPSGLLARKGSFVGEARPSPRPPQADTPLPQGEGPGRG